MKLHLEIFIWIVFCWRLLAHPIIFCLLFNLNLIIRMWYSIQRLQWIKWKEQLRQRLHKCMSRILEHNANTKRREMWNNAKQLYDRRYFVLLRWIGYWSHNVNMIIRLMDHFVVGFSSVWKTHTNTHTQRHQPINDVNEIYMTDKCDLGMCIKLSSICISHHRCRCYSNFTRSCFFPRPNVDEMRVAGERERSGEDTAKKN